MIAVVVDHTEGLRDQVVINKTEIANFKDWITKLEKSIYVIQKKVDTLIWKVVGSVALLNVGAIVLSKLLGGK